MTRNSENSTIERLFSLQRRCIVGSLRSQVILQDLLQLSYRAVAPFLLAPCLTRPMQARERTMTAIDVPINSDQSGAKGASLVQSLGAVNVGDTERWASAVGGGALLAYGLTQRAPTNALLA